VADRAVRVVAGRFEIKGGVGGALHGRDLHEGIDVLVESVPAPRGHRRLARVLMGVRHPRVARVVAVIPEGERLWVATERSGAGGIAEPLSVDSARRLAVDLASALEHLHEQGLGHGALRGTSVAETESGWVLADLAGVVLGRGTPRTDERDDVAGLAAVVYEAVAGAPPFEAPSEDLPGELRAPLLRSLQTDPRRRFGTVREAARALGAPLPEKPRRRRRWPWVVVAIGVAAAAAVAVAQRPRGLPMPSVAVAVPAAPIVAPPVIAARPTLVVGNLDYDDAADAWLAHVVPELFGMALEETSAVDLGGAGADFRLEGAVDRDGGMAWLDLRIAETKGGAFVFAERVPLPAPGAVISVLDGMIGRARTEIAPASEAPRPLAALATPSLEALSAYAEGDPRRALAADPGFAAARVALARQVPAEAEALLAGLSPERAGARVRLEASVLTARTPATQIAAWTAMRRRFPRDPRIAAALASAHRAAGDPGACAHEAETLTPPPPLLAWCRIEAGDPQGALAAARAAVGDEGRLVTGDLAVMMGRYGEAREQYGQLPEALAKARLSLVAVHAAGRCRINALLRPGWEPEVARVRVAAALACGDWPTARELEGRARRAGETALANRWSAQLAAARKGRWLPLPDKNSPIDRYAAFDPPLLLDVARDKLAEGDTEGAALACAEIRAAAPAYAPGILCEGWVADAKDERGAAFRAYRDFLDRWTGADPENRLYRDGQRKIASLVRRARQP
jgi:hypothetical protein